MNIADIRKEYKLENEDSYYRHTFHPRFIKATSEDAFYNFFVLQDIKIDLLFIDGDHSYEHAKHDISKYYSKVRSGGLFSGHDFSLPGVTRALKEFREENNIKEQIMFTNNDVWLWYKN